jgi:hypothetical protein
MNYCNLDKLKVTHMSLLKIKIKQIQGRQLSKIGRQLILGALILLY